MRGNYMRIKARPEGITISTLWKLFLKNIFSVFYFMIVGLVLAIIYTQFLVKPSFSATGTIQNIGGLTGPQMVQVANIPKEQVVIEKVAEKLNIPASEKDNKIAEIRKELIVSNYDGTTMSITISYKSNIKQEAENIVNYVIDVTIEYFVEHNPTLENKIKKQSNPIIANSTNPSKIVIYLGFVVIGAVFGMIVGIVGDLVNRRILFNEDLKEYCAPYNIIYLNRKKDSTIPPFETEEFLKGTLVLQDKMEGVIADRKARIIGVVNLGYDNYDALSGILAENLSNVRIKTLIIDLDLENPIIHKLYNVKNEKNITSILINEKPKPIEINENLYIIPTAEYTYPARFLKDERLHILIKDISKNYEYVLVKIPPISYYAPILFNFELLDLLLINTSFEGTRIKDLDSYIENIDMEHRDKLFLNGVDSSIKRNYSKIIDKIKEFLKRNKKAEEK
jgi:capsular polysaccharide biosynthesis protein